MSSIPSEYDFYCYQGDTASFEITLQEADTETPIDLTGFKVKMMVKETQSQNEAYAVVNLSSDTIVDYGSIEKVDLEGKITVRIESIKTSILKPQTYYYDIQTSTSSEVKTWVKGKFIVKGEITNGN